MRRFVLEAGARVRIDGAPYVLFAPTERGWSLVAAGSNAAVEKTTEEIERLYLDQRLVYDPHDLASTARPRPSGSISDLSPKQRDRELLMAKVLNHIRSLPEQRGLHVKETKYDPYTGGMVTRTRLEHELALVSFRERRPKPVSVATYYRLVEDKRVAAFGGEAPPVRRTGRPDWLDPTAALELRSVISDAIEHAKISDRIGMKRRGRVKSLVTTVRERIRSLHGPDAPVPSRASVYRAFANRPAYDRAVFEKGRRQADNDFRMTKGTKPAEACLDLVEFDESKAEFALFDEVFGVALGKPYVCFAVDTASHMPLGFYAGFEPCSDVSTAATLRHMCTPKVYMRDVYPSINNSWPAYGVPRWITFDNGGTQHGRTVETICTDLDAGWKYAPPFTAWFKSAVENMHHLLNTMLLQELPPGVLNRGLAIAGVDPAMHGWIGLRHFLFIFHKFIADVYCQRGVGPLKLSPRDRWTIGTARTKPSMLSHAMDLDLLFGIVREGVLDHRGLVFQDMRYLAPWMDEYRRLHGASSKMLVKINPTDLGKIHAWGPDGLWRPAWGRASWLNGMSLHTLKLIKRASSERYKSQEEAAVNAALADLRQLGAEALQMTLGLRHNARIARELGYGTQNILNNLSFDGRLGALTGPFTGQSLNPFGGERAPSSADGGPPSTEDPAPQDEPAPRGRPRRKLPIARIG